MTVPRKRYGVRTQPDTPPQIVFGHIKRKMKDKGQPWFDKFHDWSVKFRNVILLAAGFMYLTGYLVWCIYAHQHNLGALPLIQSQYLAAGFIPLVISIVFFLIPAGLLTWQKSMTEWMSTLSNRTKEQSRKIVITLGIILVAILYICLIANSISPHYKTLGLYAGLACCALAILTLPLTGRITSRKLASPCIFDVSDRFFAGYIPALCGLLAFYIYLNFTFPIWSQAMGGALPRVAQLDVQRTDLSPELQEFLLTPKSLAGKSAVVRTKPVYVFFRGTDRLLIKSYPEPTKDTYDVAAASIKSVVWEMRSIPLNAVIPVSTHSSK